MYIARLLRCLHVVNEKRMKAIFINYRRFVANISTMENVCKTGNAFKHFQNIKNFSNTFNACKHFENINLNSGSTRRIFSMNAILA